MTGMTGMKGMGGMSGMMGDMQKQMDAMMKVSPEQMKAMMPAHRQMVANLLASMPADMRKINMSGDAAWTATIDSVRQDLAQQPAGVPDRGADPAATLNQLYCWCGCIERGMRSNLECFESEHAAQCDVCLAGAEVA